MNAFNRYGLTLSFVMTLASAGCGGIDGDPATTEADKAAANELDQTSSALSAGGDFLEDPVRPGLSPTQCGAIQGRGPTTKMHCCPDGFAMQGAHLGSNMFRCVRVTTIAPGSENNSCYTDTSTVRDPDSTNPNPPTALMHACAKGYYMKGFHQANNLLHCCPGSISAEYVDSLNGQKHAYWSFAWQEAAHMCDNFGGGDGTQFVMTGIHAANNWFGCGT